MAGSRTWGVALGAALTLVFSSCEAEVDSRPVLVAKLDSRPVLFLKEIGRGNFGTGRCAPCFEQQCAGQSRDCSADPGCAVYRACLLSCPEDATGNLDGSCADACEVTSSSTTRRLAQRLRACAEGLDCDSCGREDDAPMASAESRPECVPSDGSRDPCRECLWSSCCDYQLACRDDDECGAFRDCVTAGSGSYEQKVDQCSLVHPSGREPLSRGVQCATARCNAVCAEPSPCVDCVGRHCGDLWLECIGDAQCWPMLECVSLRCTNHLDYERCELACAAQTSPEGVRAFREWLECGIGNCPQECAE